MGAASEPHNWTGLGECRITRQKKKVFSHGRFVDSGAGWTRGGCSLTPLLPSTVRTIQFYTTPNDQGNKWEFLWPCGRGTNPFLHWASVEVYPGSLVLPHAFQLAPPWAPASSGFLTIGLGPPPPHQTGISPHSAKRAPRAKWLPTCLARV